MAGNFGNSLVTDGLIRYYDMANRRSYNGTNTFMNDLSLQNVTMSLINSPTYSPNNYAGSFVFDGVNDSFAIPYFPIQSSSFAADIWTELILADSGFYIRDILSCGNPWEAAPSTLGWFIGYAISPGDLAYGVVFATGSNVTNILSQTFSPPADTFTKPSNIFIHRNTDTQRFVAYLNGIKVLDAQLNNDATLQSGSFTNKTTIGPGGQPSYSGSIYNIKIYHNKNFTEQEILQNYNALKGRFNR